MFLRLLLIAFLAMATASTVPVHAMELVDAKGNAVPVILPASPSAANRAAAEELVRCIALITGHQPQLLVGAPDPLPPAAIWVGLQPSVEKLFPQTSLSFEKPEEILLVANDQHVLIAGEDAFNGQEQTHFGTPNAVYTFLQNQLGVRWFWPGELGEDVQKRKTLTLDNFEYRYAPVFRERRFHYPRSLAHLQETNQWWKDRQRGRDSLAPTESHSFNDWWDLYHKTHPEYFALQPDGTRTPPQSPALVKLCVSNPAVAQQWLDNAAKKLRDDPTLSIIGAMPNDSGGWCVCDNCKAWDHPDAPSGVLTDRYVRFWNILARGLKERFPDRKVMVSVLAYSRNRTPPIAQKLEDNICVGYVGSFPISSEAERQQQKTDWLAWSKQATMMRYRPNLFWYSGGVWGFPTFEPEQTIEDFKFLAQNHCIGIEVDSAFMNWATLGPQLYLIAQLAYDPVQDGQALLADYYQRAFGPGAEKVRAYFDLMKQAHHDIVNMDGHTSGSAHRYAVLKVIANTYDEDLMSRAQAILDEARAATGDAQPVFRQRVEFIQSGLKYVALQLQSLAAMEKVRASSGLDASAVTAAVEVDKARQAWAETSPTFAIDTKRINYQVNMRKVSEYFGPPSQAVQSGSDNAKAIQYAPPKWAIAFEDDFKRETLGDKWQLSNPGNARIEDGHLILHDNVLTTSDNYPGLHRIEFYVTGLPDDQGRLGDLSPFIHASSSDINTGYFLQFGGMFNTFNSIRKMGKPLVDNRERKIEPGKQHRIIAEFNGSRVRLSIDNRTIMQYQDLLPLVGDKHQKMGLYVWSGAKIDRIRILTGPAVPLQSPLNDPDYE